MPTVPTTIHYHLRIDGRAWESALRQLLVSHSAIAIGDMRKHACDGEVLFLVDNLQVIQALEDIGSNRPAMDQWCVIAVGDVLRSEEQNLLDHVRPRSTHTMAIIVLDREDTSLNQIAVFADQMLQPLQSVEVIGRGMPQMTRDLAPITVGLRDSRTRGAMGDALFDRVRRSVVTVVGAGRSGSQICFQLAGLGVRRLRLIDPDVMKIENLDGMPGLTARDVGKPKVEVLAERLIQFCPEMSVCAIASNATTQQAATLLNRRCDLYVTAVDSDTPRMAISQYAIRMLTPHLDIGTLIRRDESGDRSLYADVRLLLPGTCVACTGGIADADQTMYEVSAPDGSLQAGEPTEWSDQRSGSLLHLNAIACGIACESWLRLLGGQHSGMWHRIDWPGGRTLDIEAVVPVSGGPCSFCTSHG